MKLHICIMFKFFLANMYFKQEKKSKDTSNKLHMKV